ncbi:MAG: hypothetical protein Tsb0010_04980 [Parvularculaceae bacterium]
MSISFRYGVILGVFLVIYGLIFRLLGQDASSPLGWVFYLALPVAVYAALTAYRRAGAQSYWRGATRGAVVTMIGAGIYAVYVFAFNAFIDDTLIASVRETALAELTPDAGAHEAQAEFIRLLTTAPGFAASIFVQMMIVGSGAALVIAAFMRSGREASSAAA